ncbi:MAG: elongation factor P [Thermodesulfobacteriota bacterium]
MYSTAEFRKGLKIEFQGEPFIIVDFQHVKPGKGGAFVRTRLKSLLTGLVREETFRSGDKVGRPDLQEREMQFLYQEGGQYCFMDTTTYEQFYMSAQQLGDSRLYLQEQVQVRVLFFKGQPIAVELPNFVDLRVVETEPGVKGDTASGGTKPAKLETGAVVQVPLFVQEGDLLKVDTRTGQYIERVMSR